jgi:hypothetical protein
MSIDNISGAYLSSSLDCHVFDESLANGLVELFLLYQ